MGKVDFIALSIGHAGNTLNKNLDYFTTVFSPVRLHVKQVKASKGVTDPATGHTAMIHEFNTFKSLKNSLMNFS
jgi:hypothetical protein